MEQYAKRIEEIPEDVRKDHMRDIEAQFRAFRANRAPITVSDKAWWMPFPFGWRLLGENDQAKTIITPAQTIVADKVENPFLPEVHQSWWRGKK